MNQEQVKKILLQIKEPQTEFTLIFSGKTSKKVNGLYKFDTREIILHNRNFETDNQLIYTALHEYTHHLMHEQQVAERGARIPYTRSHSASFWAQFHHLLEIAEKKGFYSIGFDHAPEELKNLTKRLKKDYIEKNAIFMQEFAQLLKKAQNLCHIAHIRYEDYLDRILQIPKSANRALEKIATCKLDPAIGFENMKKIASLRNTAKQQEAQNQLLAGKSPDSVWVEINKPLEKPDKKTALEQERKRIHRTITQLNERLSIIEKTLASL